MQKCPQMAWLLLALALAVVDTDPLAAQGCPATDNDVARSRLEYFLTQPGYQQDRADRGIAGDSHVRARVVTNTSPDSGICARLRSTVAVPAYLSAPWIYTIYEIDGRYYMVWVLGPLSETRIRIENGVLKGSSYRAPFSIFDANGNPIFDDLF